MNSLEDKVLSTDKTQRLKKMLEEKLNLKEETPIEYAYNNPTEHSLKSVPKINQTEDLVKYVCSNDGMALKHASKKLITPEICKIAVTQNSLALEYVPKKIISSELCYLAVMENGRALEYVPDDMRTKELVEMAVSYYLVNVYRHYDDTDEIYESKKKDITEKAKRQGEALGDYQGYPISFVPSSLLTDDLILKSVSYSPLSLREIPENKKTKEAIELAVSSNGLALKYVSLKKQTKALVNTALLNQPTAIQFVSARFVTQELCNDLFEKEYSCFSYFPEKYITVDMCLHLMKIKRFSISELNNYSLIEKYGTADVKIVTFDDFPDNMRNNKQVLDMIIRYCKYGALPIINWNERIDEEIKKAEEKKYLFYNMPTNKRGIKIVPLSEETMEYITPYVIYPEEENTEVAPANIKPIVEMDRIKQYVNQKDEIIVPLEPASKESIPVIYKNGSLILHELSEDSSSQTIYYVSDIHIEHQLMNELEAELNKKEDKTQGVVNELLRDLLDERISEMVEGKNGILLIGGDIADSIEFSRFFYSILVEKWRGKIISVLGNHELWDGTTLLDWINPAYKAREIEEIVNDYREMLSNYREISLLENQLFINYKNERYRTISEEDILEATTEELRDIISKSTFVVLGGIGYSGLNEHYNSDLGLYRKAITSLDEDKRRASMFNAVYEKIKQSAYDKQVIVLTHTPVYDWSKEQCNPNWIYVNGHTHQNSMIKHKNGVTVLSDNQIGYRPQKWKLNAFTTNSLWYDPFESFEDGIHKITSEQYKDFNNGRGIKSNGCNYEGTLYALKRNGMYMFVLETIKSLCLMVGGARKRLERNDVQYYYDNMELYGQRILTAIEPYKNVLKQISKEVQSFGGTGTIHGCIVDVSWSSHIYVNPFDGKLTSYWALDMLSRVAYDDIKGLLEANEPELLERFMIEYKGKSLPLIEKHLMTSDNCSELAIMPKWVFGTEMYEPSRIMKSVQYVWEQNIIRAWNEGVLNSNLPQIEGGKNS